MIYERAYKLVLQHYATKAYQGHCTLAYWAYSPVIKKIKCGAVS